MTDQATAVDPMQSLADAFEKESEAAQQAPDQEPTVETHETPPQEGEPTEEVDDPLYDLDGEQVPRSKIIEWKKGHMQQADYTRKTQEVADQRKALGQAHQEAAQQYAVQQQLIVEYAQLIAIDQQLAAYDQLDWNALVDQDATNFLKVKQQRDQLKDRRADFAATLSQKQQEIVRKQMDAHAKVISEGLEAVRKDIPDWSPELGKKISQYSMASLGFSAEELGTVVDPRHVRVLHKAYLYDELQKAKAQTKQKVAGAPPVLKPGAGNPKRQRDELANLRSRLSKTGSVGDAAAIFERII